VTGQLSDVEEEDEASEAVARSTTPAARVTADSATAAAEGVVRFLESTSRVGVVVEANVVWVMSSSSQERSTGTAGRTLVGETKGREG